MPRHLISDAHEWINEIPTVPIYYLAKPKVSEKHKQNNFHNCNRLSGIITKYERNNKKKEF